MSREIERVKSPLFPPPPTTYKAHTTYRIITMPCCTKTIEWLGKEVPQFCPRCGAALHAQLTTNYLRFVTVDVTAQLVYKLPD